MTEEVYNLLVFNSTHHALEAEDRLKERNYEIMVVPVPPEISANCGIAVKFSENEAEVLSLVEESTVETAGCYQVIKQGLEKRIRKV
ncbi:MAG: DUF3343 domain-containing protein [Halanaerobacter sp.]